MKKYIEVFTPFINSFHTFATRKKKSCWQCKCAWFRTTTLFTVQLLPLSKDWQKTVNGASVLLETHQNSLKFHANYFTLHRKWEKKKKHSAKPKTKLHKTMLNVPYNNAPAPGCYAVHVHMHSCVPVSVCRPGHKYFWRATQTPTPTVTEWLGKVTQPVWLDVV